MALVICPEEQCGRKGISTTATNCPSCGADIQNFLKNGFTENALAFPIDPMEYWNNWHFFYYGGKSIDKIRPAPEGWLDFGEPLIRFRDIEVSSPVSGLVVRSAVELHPEIEVGYSFKCNHFIVVRLDKRLVHKEGTEMEQFEIGHIFHSFYDAIEAAEKSDGPIRRMAGKVFGGRSSFDLTSKFESREQLLAQARKLGNLQAVWVSKATYEKAQTYYL